MRGLIRQGQRSGSVAAAARRRKGPASAPNRVTRAKPSAHG
jgi:hypothetical protein